MELPTVPGGPVERPGRVIRNSRGWFTEGSRLKTEARRGRRCVECRRALSTRRTPYCSRMCQWRFQGRYFWDAARIYVMRRDRYTCAKCRSRYRVRFLEVDHILEVASGGASLDYANLQTICKRCHREKTREFARWRAESRRAPGPEGAEREWLVDWFPS